MTNRSVIEMISSVGIVLRTKDRPILLTRALVSIIQQTYQNWHIYLVNDGGDPEAIDKILQLYQPYLNNKITIAHFQHSLGLAGAINHCLEKISEDFLAIHDDDDSWHPEFLKKTVNFLFEHPELAAVSTNSTVINEEICNNIIVQINTHPWPNWQDQITITNLHQHNSLLSISLLIRMDAVKQIGKFNEEFGFISDWEYHLRLIKYGEIGVLNKKLAYYHQRQNTLNNYANFKIIFNNRLHQQKNIYIDRYMRQLVQENQNSHNVAEAQLFNISLQNQEIFARFFNLEQNIKDIQHSTTLTEIHQSVQYLKRKSFPLKRLAAKFRKKIKSLT